MQLDPKQSLQLAFKHLDAFSVPEVGTFKRTRNAAKVDHHKKRVHPPMEMFVLESGQDAQQAFEDFLFRYHNLKIDAAKGHLEELGKFVANELDHQQFLYIDGFGKLRKAEAGGYDFEPDDSVFAQSSDFFGLQAVDFNLQGNTKADSGTKEAVAKKAVKENQQVVEPAPAAKRKFPVFWFALLFILLLASGAGVIWQKDLVAFMESKGWMGSSSNPTTIASNEQPAEKPSAEDSNPANVVPETEPVQETPAVSPAKEEVPATKPVAKVEKPVLAPKEESPKTAPIVTKPTVSNRSDIGDQPQRGLFYLVIASPSSGDEAASIAADIKASGAQPRVLAAYGNGLFKVSAFEHADKNKVIQKMVAWKKQYSKSWIYWVGM